MYESLGAINNCGTVGSQLTNLTIPLGPSGISSVNERGIPTSLNVSDLLTCTDDRETLTGAQTNIWGDVLPEKCLPSLNWEPRDWNITAVQQAWTSCVPIGGEVFDPPRWLQSVASPEPVMTPITSTPMILPAPGAKPIDPVSLAQATAQPDIVGDVQGVPLHGYSADRKHPPSSTSVVQGLEFTDPTLRPLFHPEKSSGDNLNANPTPDIVPSTATSTAGFLALLEAQFQEDLQSSMSFWPFQVISQGVGSSLSKPSTIIQTRPSAGKPQIIHVHRPVVIRLGDMVNPLRASAMAASPSNMPTTSRESLDSDSDNSM